MAETQLETLSAHPKGKISLMGAIFIGIGSMVGAGLFALFGEAGTIAGAAVWVSFLIGGIIALLQGYSFAKLGARYPSAGGMISWMIRGFAIAMISQMNTALLAPSGYPAMGYILAGDQQARSDNRVILTRRAFGRECN